jgi:Leucine-rich repeat (LRR) protein
MNKLTKDPLFLVALELNDVDMANFCKSNKKFNEQICKKDTIWYHKLSQLDKKYSKDIQKLKKEVNTLRNTRELYQLVKSLILAKEAFKVDWSLSELYNRERISLRYKKIEKIPNLSQFKKLRALNLNNNKIKEIPETLPDSLRELYLANNDIKQIPDTLPNSLQYLYLSGNQIEEIPKTLPNSLRLLLLAVNQIKEIPDTLPNLQIFDLRFNKIKEIPEKYKNFVEI